METTQPRLSRTQILPSGTENATVQPLTISAFEPNRLKRPATPQQNAVRGVTPSDLTAGILEAGRQAQREAQQFREAVTSRAATTTPRPLLIHCKDLGGGTCDKTAPAQQKTPEKTSRKTPKWEIEQAQDRLEKWAMLDAARGLLGLEHRTGACFRQIIPTPHDQRPSSGEKFRGVDIHHTTREDGTTRARFGNLITCGSVWACPICSERIAAQRATELQNALQQHTEQGGRLMFVTLTHHHERGTKLTDQLKQQSQALKIMQENYAYKKICQQNGVLGMVRGLEMTHSDMNGWHAHLHFLVLLAGNEGQAQQHAQVLTALDEKRAESVRKSGRTPRQKNARQPVEIPRVTKLPKFGRDMITQWQQSAKKAGLYAVRDAQKAIIASDDEGTLAELAKYLTKCELKTDADGKKQWIGTGEDNAGEFGGEAAHRDAVLMVENAGTATGSTSSAALELTMSNHKKRSRTPMGMLREYALGRIHNPDSNERKAQDRKARRMGALFVEFAFATRGKNALVWGAGLKTMYAVPDVDDNEMANVEDENTVLDVLLMTLTPDEWNTVLHAPRGTRGKLLEVARGGDVQTVMDFVNALQSVSDEEKLLHRFNKQKWYLKNAMGKDGTGTG